MNRNKFFLVLIVVLSPLFVNAQVQNIEFGLQAGAGLFVGVNNPIEGYTRTNEFALVANSDGFPAFETFGALIRYRFDTRWALQLQGMRQRLRFKETSNVHNDELYFYNAMWNIDLMTEFNILKYGFSRNRNARIFTFTPYVAVGIGTSLYNKKATYSFRRKETTHGTSFSKDGVFPYPPLKLNELAIALYVPFAVGMKISLAESWQLKVACQYDLYVMNGDICGSTIDDKIGYPNGGGVDLAKVQYNVASTHNVAATIGVIYNISSKNQGGSVIRY